MKRTILFHVLIASLVGLLGGCTLMDPASKLKPSAQEKLDQLFGSNHGLPERQTPSNQAESKPSSPLKQSLDRAMDRMSPFEGMGDLLSKPLERAFAQPEVQIHETPEQIELRIPLDNPEDEKNIEVNVKPNGVQVLGRFTSGNGKGFSSSTTFMRFFGSSAPLDPQHVRRQVTQDMLMVVIPKVGHVGISKPLEQHPRFGQTERALPPEVLKQLPNTKQQVI